MWLTSGILSTNERLFCAEQRCLVKRRIIGHSSFSLQSLLSCYSWAVMSQCPPKCVPPDIVVTYLYPAHISRKSCLTFRIAKVHVQRQQSAAAQAVWPWHPPKFVGNTPNEIHSCIPLSEVHILALCGLIRKGTQEFATRGGRSQRLLSSRSRAVPERAHLASQSPRKSSRSVESNDIGMGATPIRKPGKDRVERHYDVSQLLYAS